MYQFILYTILYHKNVYWVLLQWKLQDMHCYSVCCCFIQHCWCGIFLQNSWQHFFSIPHVLCKNIDNEHTLLKCRFDKLNYSDANQGIVSLSTFYHLAIIETKICLWNLLIERTLRLNQTSREIPFEISHNNFLRQASYCTTHHPVILGNVWDPFFKTLLMPNQNWMRISHTIWLRIVVVS